MQELLDISDIERSVACDSHSEVVKQSFTEDACKHTAVRGFGNPQLHAVGDCKPQATYSRTGLIPYRSHLFESSSLRHTRLDVVHRHTHLRRQLQ